MPRLNNSGGWLGGVAGAQTLYNGALIPYACCGNWAFLRPDTPIGQRCDTTGCAIITLDGAVAAGKGANFFAAGGERWAARLDSFFSNFIDPNDAAYADASPLWIDHEGYAAILMSYASGSNVRIVRPDNSTLDVPLTVYGPLYSGDCNVRMQNRLLTVRTSGGFQIFDADTGASVPNAKPMDADACMACRLDDGRVVVIERLTTDASLRVRFADQPSGEIVTTWQTGAETFYPVITPLGSVVRAAWSGNIGDTDVKLKDIDVSTLPGAATTQAVHVTTTTTTPAVHRDITELIAVIGGLLLLYVLAES